MAEIKNPLTVVQSGGGGISLDDVFIYILDFATDTIVMTAGGYNVYAGFFTT